ncbi:MAG TPA: L,D-transpeptidase family protein [Acetobacteraceae bacterium]|nr:L,D-transpeptidase family protein [Acetobacteraceae bacterium]
MTEARVGADGVLQFGAGRYRAALGRGGLTTAKREGDGATPVGHLPLRRILYRADRVRRPRTKLPTLPLAPHDGWCDDPGHADYNRLVRLPHDGRHETLWRADGVYDVIAVLGWNDAPVERGRGSAIFLHVARPDWAATEGCVALALPDLLEVLEAGLSTVITG